jgi:hypothetical protein
MCHLRLLVTILWDDLETLPCVVDTALNRRLRFAPEIQVILA